MVHHIKELKFNEGVTKFDLKAQIDKIAHLKKGNMNWSVYQDRVEAKSRVNSKDRFGSVLSQLNNK